MGTVSFVLREFRLLHGFTQARENGVLIGAHDNHVVVRRRIDVGRGDFGQDRTGSFPDGSELVIFRHRGFHHTENRFENCRIHHLTLSGTIPGLQRGQRADGGKHGGKRIAYTDTDPARRRGRIADDVTQPPHGLADAAVTGTRGIRALLPVPGNSDHDDTLVDPGQVGISQAPFLHGARPEVLQNDIRFFHQFLHDGLPLPRPDIQGDAFLVARDNGPPDRFPFPPFPHRVAAPGQLNLDHLGAQVRQQLPAERPGDELSEFENAYPFEGAGSSIVPVIIHVFFTPVRCR